MDLLDLAALSMRPFKRVCRIPRDLDAVTSRAEEVPAREVHLTRANVEAIWRSAQALYRTGLYPALQLCVRHRGAIVLDRTIGHAAGNAPLDPPDTPKRLATPDTPFRIYSASKAVTAMVVHLLDERGALHIDDPVCEYLPEFGVGSKRHITIAHVLCHRAGIPNLPEGAMDLDLLETPEQIVRMLAAMPLVSRPGRELAYHAVSGGFVLGEVVRRATGTDIRSVLDKEVRAKLGLRWLSYGVEPADVHAVAKDAITGLAPIPPFSTVLARALGAPVERVLEIAHDPRFLAGILPAANVVANARDLCTFFECLRTDGALDGARVFEPRTVRRARTEQSLWELDFTLGLPLRYGLGFMLGADWLSLFGPGTRHAFGHLGFTNVVAWADPDRELSAALCTSGKPFLNVELLRLLQCLIAIGREVPRTRPKREAKADPGGRPAARTGR
ncbi:MAG: hydrolase [Proteobacteria bacterium]|nr:MAG: hydrolase [Pseudomonadota bacterium]